MKCKKCSKDIVKLLNPEAATFRCKAYAKDGHNHEDTCRIGDFLCEDGHVSFIGLRNTCPHPECDWRGTETCWCHQGEKLEIDISHLLEK